MLQQLLPLALLESVQCGRPGDLNVNGLCGLSAQLSWGLILAAQEAASASHCRS